MMPPPTKKKKINAAATADIPARGQPDAPSNGPHLMFELIAQVAKFASSSGRGRQNDLQNICVAVGRRHIDGIRHSFLNKNYRYLRMCLIYSFLLSIPQPHQLPWSIYNIPDSNKRHLKCQRNILEWMNINSHWRKLCTRDSIETWKTRNFAPPFRAKDDKENVLIIFNHPSLIITLGLIDILKYMVDVQRIDVNGYYSEPLRIFGGGGVYKHHLLSLAMPRHNPLTAACFDYLLENDNINVHSKCRSIPGWQHDDEEDESRDIVERALECDASMQNFESIIQHKSFMARDFLQSPLRYASTFLDKIERKEGEGLHKEEFLAKLEIALKSVANSTEGVAKPSDLCDKDGHRYFDDLRKEGYQRVLRAMKLYWGEF